MNSLLLGKDADVQQKYCKDVHMQEDFGGSVQQDASEFMGWLLETLQEEFNYSRARGPLLPLTASQEAVRREQPDIRSSWMQWQRYYHTTGSVITDTFFGQDTQTITCLKCGFVEKNWQPWAQIYVPVAVPDDSTISLEHLLDAMYAKPSELEDYRCNKCNEKGPIRSMNISRCPQILVIVIGRYEWRGETSHRKKNIVTFPLGKLSLDPYFISHAGMDLKRLDDGFTAPFDYSCYGVVRHEGKNTKTGHYTCLIKETAKNGKDVWVAYDDHRISEVKSIDPESQTSRAYMLFYRRLSSPSKLKDQP